jgi:hypothetical protein
LRKLVTDGEGIHDLEFILVNVWSFDVESRLEERLAAAMTASAQRSFLLW